MILKRSSVICAAFILGACADVSVSADQPVQAAHSTTPSHSGATFDQSDAALAQACTDDRFSGIVVATTSQDTLYTFSCNGAGPSDMAIDANTNFKLFSTSKQFTAAIILQLIDEGNLSFDTPAHLYFEGAPDSWGDVTVGDLLIHTSGIPDLTNDLLLQFQNGLTDHSQAVQATISEADPSPESTGTETWAYNNFGFEMLAVIAGQADGGTFEKLMQDRIFDPAGMDHARLEMPDESASELRAVPDDRLVQGYNGAPGERMPALSYSFVQQGAGAVHASANDLVNYYRALAEGTILSREMQDRQRDYAFELNERTTVVPGWFVGENRSHETLSHSGGNNGYISWFGYMPEQDVAIIMLSNYGDAPTREIREVLYDDLFGAVDAAETAD